MPGTLERYDLDDSDHVLVGQLPSDLCGDPVHFAHMWSLHPEHFHEIHMHGRKVLTPRWQQAYGADYRYTGQVHRALPLTPVLGVYLEWCRSEIDARLNGLLLNWYEGQKQHYIGAHRDSTSGMIEGCAIVTISLGQERIFRLRPWKGRGYEDIVVEHGAVVVLPYATNLRWTHEVPHFARHDGRRISITARGFEQTRA